MAINPICEHDLHYRCENCAWESAGTDHLDPSTWLCRTCERPALITIEDNRFQRFAVQRVPAEQLVAGDQVLHRGFITLGPVDVLKSRPDRSHPGRWSLSLAGVSTQAVALGSFYDRIRPS